MGFWKLCPICFELKIYRREIRTCGSPNCQAEWRSLTPSGKAKAVERAEQMKDHGFIAPLPTIPTMPADSNDADREFLEKRMSQEQIDKLFGGPPPKKPEDDEK
jgi:hypothetical protein